MLRQKQFSPLVEDRKSPCPSGKTILPRLTTNLSRYQIFKVASGLIFREAQVDPNLYFTTGVCVEFFAKQLDELFERV